MYLQLTCTISRDHSAYIRVSIDKRAYSLAVGNVVLDGSAVGKDAPQDAVLVELVGCKSSDGSCSEWTCPAVECANVLLRVHVL